MSSADELPAASRFALGDSRGQATPTGSASQPTANSTVPSCSSPPRSTRSSGQTELSPESYELQFPLSVGKKYTHKTSVPGVSGRNDIDMKAEAIGWEQVETPAGKFDALRVDFVGYRRSQSAMRSRAVRDMQVWYAPAAKTIVRVAAKSFAEVSRRPMADWATQLVDYKVGP